MKGSYLAILIALALLLSAANSDGGNSKKNSPTKHKRESAVETDATKERDNQAEVLLSAIQSEQADILKLTEAIKHEGDARQEQYRADNKSLPLLSRLTALRVQQGLLVVGVLYTFFAAWQLLQIRRQANIAETVLTFAERPYLGIQIMEAAEGQRVFRTTVVVHCLWIQYRFVNSGRTPAFMTDTNAIIAITDSRTPPTEPPYKKADWTPARATIGAGQWHDAETWIGLQSRTDIMDGRKFAHFFVYVAYEDRLGEEPRPHRSWLSGLVAWDTMYGFHLTFPTTHTYVGNT